MKKVIFTLFLSLNLFILNANPFVLPSVITEIFFDSLNYDNWYLELYFSPYYQWGSLDDLDNSFLVSSTDTAYFKPGITINLGVPLVIAQYNMQSTLFINPDGDNVYLWWYSSYYGYIESSLSFGNSHIKPPYFDQSLALQQYGSLGDEGWVLCKETPQTLGSQPYTVDARGALSGYIYDQLNNPVPNLKLKFYPETTEAIIDDNGYFYISQLLCFTRFSGIYYDEVYIDHFTVDIEPYSTSYIEFHLDTTLTAISNYASAENYVSIFNYPNPCTSYTVFKCSLPENMNFSAGNISIYSQNGQLVDHIFFEKKPDPNYQIYWDAPVLNDGMYIYTLELDGKVITTNKLTVLR